MPSRPPGPNPPSLPDWMPPTAESAERAKKRRYQSRSSEEVLEEMDKRNLSYRIGWPTLPPLPVHNAPFKASAFVGNHGVWRAKALSILDDLSINDHSLEFFFRVPRNTLEDTQDPARLRRYLTLMFNADTMKDKDKIITAVTRIRMQFKNHNDVDEVMIECIDRRAETGLATHAIEFDEHKILDSWDLLRPMLRELFAKNKRRWIALELLRRGLFDDPQECPLTIVISTPTAGDLEWYTKIIPLVRNASTAVGLNAQVEILAALHIENGGKNFRHKYSGRIDERAYREIVSMGASIGISGDNISAGTLGCSITLDDGTAHGLTNWQVVRDDRLDAIVSKTQGALAPGNKTLKNSPQIILSPATLDHEGRLGDLQFEMDTYRAYPNRQTDFKIAKREFKKTEKAPRVLGSVYAGSGRRTVLAPKNPQTKGKGKGKAEGGGAEFNWPLDWALVKISNVNVKDITNELPSTTIVDNDEEQLSYPTGLNPLQRCDKWTNINIRSKRILVAKYGRTSAWTFGVINTALVEIELCDEIAKVYGFTTQFRGSCFGVVNRNSTADFLRPGDSGSILVHDDSGTQLGLLFGTTESESLMIPHRFIFEDIEKVTGKKVIQPEYIDPAKVGLAPYQQLDPED